MGFSHLIRMHNNSGETDTRYENEVNDLTINYK